MEKEKIIIVGAGISGLMLGRELAEQFDVTILEANKIAGGRIQTISTKDFPIPIEAGAEFIHGQLKHTLSLLKEAGIKYETVEGKMYSNKKGKWKEQHEMIEGWDELMKTMKKSDADMVFYDFLKANFAGEKYNVLRKYATAFAEGFDVADTKKVSTKSLYKEWSRSEEKNFRIQDGYGALVNFLLQQNIEKGSHIIYNQTVKVIRWKKNEASVQTSGDKIYTGSKLFITLPIGVLQDSSSTCSINFIPALQEQMEAASQIGFGPVVKIILFFKKPFWKKDSGFIFSEEIIPTWWTQLPNQVPILTGWAGGTRAESLNNESKKSLLAIALVSLSNIFDISILELENNLLSSYVANWNNKNWSAGAYSYATPQTKAARQLLNEPVEHTIYFCGEGIYEGEAPGTVEASIGHALKTAKKIKM